MPLEAAPAQRAQALDEARRQGIVAGEVVQAQSFGVRGGAGTQGVRVSGRGQQIVAGRDNAACFAVLVAGQPPRLQFIPTVGAGAWEADACLGVAAVGLLRASPRPDRPALQRLGLRYRAASPHAAMVEPVILRCGAGLRGFVVDEAATAAASRAGATTLKDMARAALTAAPPASSGR